MFGLGHLIAYIARLYLGWILLEGFGVQGIQCTLDRPLFISQDYDQAYLSIAEFDDEYVQYVRGSVDEPKDGEPKGGTRWLPFFGTPQKPKR